MQVRKIILAAVLAVPMLALAQVAASQARPDVKATFAVLKANVDKITLPSEGERWRANRDAWEVLVAQTGRASAVDLGKMTAALDKMKANVEKIRAGSEKERWQANIDLWQLLISHDGVFAKADIAAATASLATIKNNVAAISSATEKERWSADRDLWQVMIDRANQGVKASR